MQLSESKLFTIEALNRIEGFVWPEDASFACSFNIVNGRNFGVEFYIEKPVPSNAIEAFKGALSKGDPTKVILGQHPDWRNSLITKAEFDSVDGWVRNTKLKLPAELVDSQIEVMFHNCEIAFDDANAFYWDENVSKWRYRKPINETATLTTKQEVKPEIHAIYESYKQQCATTADAQRALDASKDAEDALLEQIKQWNLQYGFDVRLLDESEEKPDQQDSELVITDWRDLRVGDMIFCDYSGGIFSSGEYPVIAIEDPNYKGIDVIRVQINNHTESWVLDGKWKFIRRPSK